MIWFGFGVYATVAIFIGLGMLKSQDKFTVLGQILFTLVWPLFIALTIFAVVMLTGMNLFGRVVFKNNLTLKDFSESEEPELKSADTRYPRRRVEVKRR